MSKVLVVGNGFDIALGLRSKYSDYINTMAGTNKNAFWPFKEIPKGKYADCSLYCHFFKYFHPTENTQNIEDNYYHVKWIDIEGELLKYVQSKFDSPIDDELAKEDEASFQNLKMMLQKYISVMPTIEPKSPDKYFLRLLETIKSNGQFDKAYSFNYTDLRDELIRLAKFKESELPSVVNVHRTPSDENFFNIVLGINEDKRIPPSYRFLFKSMQTEPNDMAQDMVKADEVILYGLSLGEIDFPYFKSFFDHILHQPILSQKKYITIFTAGQNSVNSIWDSFHNANILIHDLKEKSYFNIIDMENILLPGYDESAFIGILNRLKSQ